MKNKKKVNSDCWEQVFLAEDDDGLPLLIIEHYSDPEMELESITTYTMSSIDDVDELIKALVVCRNDWVEFLVKRGMRQEQCGPGIDLKEKKFY